MPLPIGPFEVAEIERSGVARRLLRLSVELLIAAVAISAFCLFVIMARSFAGGFNG